MFGCHCFSWLVVAKCFFFSVLYPSIFAPPPNPTYGKYIVSMLGSTDWQCDGATGWMLLSG